MPSTSKAPSHAPPLIFPPSKSHKTTIILLHGRGSTAERFAEPLLTHHVSTPAKKNTPSASSPAPAPTPNTFQDHFPHTKFVVPTAPLRRAVVFKRSLTHQWFDNWSLTQPELKQHLQIPGLRETSAFLHGLLGREIEAVGAKNIILMGLSQGCASSLVSALLWRGEAFGAVVGMCGYVPFRKGMGECADGGGDGEGEEDVFAREGEEEEDVFERGGLDVRDGGGKFDRAVGWLREELEVDGGGDQGAPPMQSIPVFMGHGMEDEKVPCEIGRLAADFLKDIGVEVAWNEYAGLGHWYSDEMLGDVIGFLRNLEGWGGYS